MPSGTLWATENIKDANGNELYFAWGETSGYTAEQVGTDKYFAWEGENADYKFGPVDWNDETDYGLTKYNVTDGKTKLDEKDDAATANWGENWRMPIGNQFYELTANATTAWTQVDGVNGVLFTSTANTNTLFFPAVGYAEDGMVIEKNYGYYWSASLDGNGVNYGSELNFNRGNCEPSSNYRCRGYFVRPVRRK